MKFKKYSAPFLDINGNAWEAQIWQESDEAFSDVMELELPADQPLVIEWTRAKKEDPICGSMATLKVISPGDRTFVDLYTIEVGSVRLDVYKNGSLYWSGSIDPEFYEEPYEAADNYEVTLAFTDLGCLDRLSFDGEGLISIKQVILRAIEASGVNHVNVDTSKISSTLEDGVSGLLEGVFARSDNFYDEDGKPMSWREVLEGVLQPLALKVIQRDGGFYVYDLNALWESDPQNVVWDGASQVLSTDTVTNNIEINFSTYGENKIIDSDIEYTGGIDNAASDNGGFEPHKGTDYAEAVPWHLFDIQPKDRSFRLYHSREGSGVKLLSSRIEFCLLRPVISDTGEVSFVAQSVANAQKKYVDGDDIESNWEIGTAFDNDMHIFSTDPVYVPALPEKESGKVCLRLKQEALWDCKYNPFSKSEAGNMNDNLTDELKDMTRCLRLRVKMELSDSKGAVIAHYENKSIANIEPQYATTRNRGIWVPGADASEGDFYLSYYGDISKSEKCEDSLLGGWITNKPTIGYITYNTYPNFDGALKKGVEGEIIPYPPTGGYITITVCGGVKGQKIKEKAEELIITEPLALRFADKMRWALYKAPKLEIVNDDVIYTSAEVDDITYSGILNPQAKDDMSIDTICGTIDGDGVVGRGVLYTKDGQLKNIMRAGRLGHPEKLLIGTLYSQYAQRKVKLRGEATIDGGLHCYSEDNQGEKKFMLTSDVQNIIECVTDAEFVEISQDEYGYIDGVV